MVEPSPIDCGRSGEAWKPKFLAEPQNLLGGAKVKIEPGNAKSDLHSKSHLDDGVVRNLEEIGCPARDPV
jgi:hypothetical protein